MPSSPPASTITSINSSEAGPRWSGLETPGMKEAKSSLLLPKNIKFKGKIKTLPEESVIVYRDQGVPNKEGLSTSSNNEDSITRKTTSTNSFTVIFPGCTLFQLEPLKDTTALKSAVAGSSSTTTASSSLRSHKQQQTLPVTLTIGGRCTFKKRNLKNFTIMMRTREQSGARQLSSNSKFDWPDVMGFRTCPVCAQKAVPHKEREYWMVFYPLLQISLVPESSKMQMGLRTICRLTCIECMEQKLLFGMTIKTSQISKTNKKNKGKATKVDDSNRNHNDDDNDDGAGQVEIQDTKTTTTDLDDNGDNKESMQKQHEGRPSDASLPAVSSALEVLYRAGSATFLQDSPPRPASHPHIDDVMDAWTLYNLWEQTGAWEALQNDYREVLTKSMQASASGKHKAMRINNIKNSIIQEQQPPPSKENTKPATAAVPAVASNETREVGSKVHGSKIPGDTNGDEDHVKKLVKETPIEEKAEEAEKEKKKKKKKSSTSNKEVRCRSCRKRLPLKQMKKCSRCRSVVYCSAECQKADWENHKTKCFVKKKKSSSEVKEIKSSSNEK